MLQVRVNLRRLEYLENCARDNLPVCGSDLRRLESFARKEYTGFVKKRYTKMLKRTKKRSSDDETSSVMSRDEIERDLKVFVGKHQIPSSYSEKGFDERTLERVKSFVFNGHKMNGLVKGGVESVVERHSSKTDLSQLKKNLVPTREEVESLSRRVEVLRKEYEEMLQNSVESESDDETEIERELQAKLSKTVSINSIILTKSTRSMETEADGDSRLVHQKIEGCAGSVPFTLEILIQHMKSIGSLENANVVDLDLSIPKNCHVQEELESFIEKMRSCRDVMLCFRGLEKYASWYLMRQKTFRHFVTNKPSIASLSEDPSNRELHLTSTHNHVRATISWTFRTEATGHLTPVISLTARKTKIGAFVDVDNVISKLPSMFQLMQDLYGIERAIDIVIDMLSL